MRIWTAPNLVIFLLFYKISLEQVLDNKMFEIPEIKSFFFSAMNLYSHYKFSKGCMTLKSLKTIHIRIISQV